MADSTIEVIARALETRAKDYLNVAIEAAGTNEERRSEGEAVEVKDRDIVRTLADVHRLQRAARRLRDGSLALSDVPAAGETVPQPVPPSRHRRKAGTPKAAAAAAADSE